MVSTLCLYTLIPVASKTLSSEHTTTLLFHMTKTKTLTHVCIPNTQCTAVIAEQSSSFGDGGGFLHKKRCFVRSGDWRSRPSHMTDRGSKCYHSCVYFGRVLATRERPINHTAKRDSPRPIYDHQWRCSYLSVISSPFSSTEG